MTRTPGQRAPSLRTSSPRASAKAKPTAPSGVRHEGGDGERLQKLLAGAGIASRRQIEAWVKAGRITVNGVAAQPGLRVGPKDVILIDGRRVRVDSEKAVKKRVILYHRPPGEPLSATLAVEIEGQIPVPSSYDRLPSIKGHRWLPLSPLAPIDTGLEVFTTDGVLRAAAGKQAHEIHSVYAVRLRGELSPEVLNSLPEMALNSDPPFDIHSVEAAGGEGSNFWLNLTVQRARGRDLRTLFAALQLEVSRVMRTHYGSLGMDRALARGRHRELTDEEIELLYQDLKLAAAVSAEEAAPRSPTSARPKKPRGSNRPANR